MKTRAQLAGELKDIRAGYTNAVKRAEAAEAEMRRLRASEAEAIRAIEFALSIDDHFDRLEFLEGWLRGDLTDWPEFKSAIPHAHMDRSGLR